MVAVILALLLAALPLRLQELPHAFPREGARQLFDNERVTVWEVTWEKGKATHMHRHRYDFVAVDLAVAATKATTLDGVSRIVRVNPARAGFTQKGDTHMQEGTSDVPRHAIVVDIKDVSVPPLANTSGYAAAFPREGARKLVDNARVTVWDVSFTAGKPTPMHFHDKDVVAVYIGDGATSSTTPEGVTTVSPHFPGEARFLPRNRTHTELLPSGRQRVIAVELK
jgi:quercetin dioxygenase-like cupin family protein